MICNGEMYGYKKSKILVREENLYFLVRTEKNEENWWTLHWAILKYARHMFLLEA